MRWSLDFVTPCLREWGRLLYAPAAHETAREAVEKWQSAGKDHPRRFTVLVDPEVVAGSSAAAQQDAAEAATLLLGLPCELMHDEQDYSSWRYRGVQVRSRLPNRKQRDRVVEALAQLGELVELTFLSPPTFQALKLELRRASEKKKGYHVVHFGSHGVYDKKHGLGALCFEFEEDKMKLAERRTNIVDANELARVV
jgi:hypothetical protein